MLRNGSKDATGGAEGGPFMYEGTDGTTPVDPPVMASLIREEIIPRLIAAHCTAGTGAGGTGAGGTGAGGTGAGGQSTGRPRGVAGLQLDPAAIADLAVGGDLESLLDLAHAALAGGIDLDSFFLEHLAPTARLLGERWELDTTDFVDVTMGLWRLQELVHALAAQRSGREGRDSGPGRILLAVVPGDTHSFGSVMLEQMFVHAGWETGSCRGEDADHLIAAVARSWFDVVALTASIDQNSAALADLLSRLRRRSMNPGLAILAGGPTFLIDPGLAPAIGADATASDGRAAIRKAGELVAAGRLMASAVTGARRMARSPLRSAGPG